VIGLPASICCQWRAENPKPIISSCVYSRALRSFRILSPNVRKNRASSITGPVLRSRWQMYHEQISWSCLKRDRAGECS